MDPSRRFQQMAGVSCLLAGVCYVSCCFAFAAAVNFNLSPAAFSGALIATGPRGAELLGRGLWLDGFGSYLLLAPLAVTLWDWFKLEQAALAGLFTLSGLAYMLVGAMGAFALAAALPPMIIAYGSAAATQRATLQAVFDAFFNAVYRGLWNPLEVILLGVWLLGLGPWIARRRPALGRFTQLVGLAAWVDAAGALLGLEWLFTAGLGVLLALLPFWMVWWGIDLVRGAMPAAVGTGAQELS